MTYVGKCFGVGPRGLGFGFELRGHSQSLSRLEFELPWSFEIVFLAGTDFDMFAEIRPERCPLLKPEGSQARANGLPRRRRARPAPATRPETCTFAACRSLTLSIALV